MKSWSSVVEEQIEEYRKSMQVKAKEFKTRSFYDDKLSVQEATVAIAEAEKYLSKEWEELQKKTLLVTTFEFPYLIKSAKDCVDDLRTELAEMKVLWQTALALEEFLSTANKYLWHDMKIEELEDGAKAQVKNVKSLHKCVRWTNAFKRIDKLSKDFLNTIPLISLLCAKSMRDRHWIALKTITKKEFSPPYANPDLLLGSILDLHLHEFSGDVEEICDQAVKELKIENTLTQIAQRWSSIVWLMDTYKDTDVPLLKLSEEDFESLEGDQLVVQGMLASRFVKQFEQEAQSVSDYSNTCCC
jgi:dynein heavy chain